MQFTLTLQGEVSDANSEILLRLIKLANPSTSAPALDNDVIKAPIAHASETPLVEGEDEQEINSASGPIDENDEDTTMTDRVLALTTRFPTITKEGIADNLGIPAKRAYNAIHNLRSTGRVIVMTGRSNDREHRYLSVEQDGDVTTFSEAVRRIVQRNPGITSSEIIRALKCPGGRVTGALSNMLVAGKVTAQGDGSLANGPFRYTWAQAAKS